MRKFFSSGAFSGIIVRTATEREREKEPLPGGVFSQGFPWSEGENGLGQARKKRKEKRAKKKERKIATLP
jgi:hypothetical protein